MNKVKLLITFMVVLLILSSTGWGVDSDDSIKSLQGIKGVMVVISDIKPEFEKGGLTKKHIQKDVELKLRMAGLKVLSWGERSKTPGMPYISVVPYIIKTASGMYVFNVTLSLAQRIYLERNSKLITAATWDYLATGFTQNLDDIRSKIKDLVDIFLNEWLSVNPKK